MVGTEFIDLVSKFQLTTYAGLEDFADKFNFLYTVVVISLCTLVITVKQYVMKPISCYIATEVGGTNLLNYVENYCWVQGTVPISYTGRIPDNQDGWDEYENQKILYYQWVPFVLGLQCILFYIPRTIWQAICHNQTGTDLENVISQSMNAVQLNGSSRERILTDICTTIEHLLHQQQMRKVLRNNGGYANLPLKNAEKIGCTNSPDHQQRRRMQPSTLSALSRRKGTYIVTFYLLLKVLYLINAIGQIFLMQEFLGFRKEKYAFGAHVLDNIVHGRDWELTLIFPRVGFCFVKMKMLGIQTNGVTAQCALPVNMLNEKIYAFLWWWIVLAACFTTGSLFIWLYRICMQSREADYVVKYLQLSDNAESFEFDVAHQFASEFLRRDGMFLIRMIRMNAGDMVAAEVAKTLWDRWIQQTKMADVFRSEPMVGWTAPLEKGGRTDDRIDGKGDAYHTGGGELRKNVV